MGIPHEDGFPRADEGEPGRGGMEERRSGIRVVWDRERLDLCRRES